MNVAKFRRHFPEPSGGSALSYTFDAAPASRSGRLRLWTDHPLR